MPTVASSVKGEVMKTDAVLTMDEYLDACCVIPKHVNPTAGNSRHVPITSEGDIDRRNEENGYRCDRWGHPCPDCLEKREQ